MKVIDISAWQENIDWEAVKAAGVELCARVAADILEENHYDEDEKTAYDKAIEERVVRTLQKTVSRLVDWSSRSSFDTMYLEQSRQRRDADLWLHAGATTYPQSFCHCLAVFWRRRRDCAG